MQDDKVIVIYDESAEKIEDKILKIFKIYLKSKRRKNDKK